MSRLDGASMKTLKVFSLINLKSYDLMALSHIRVISGFVRKKMKYKHVNS